MCCFTTNLSLNLLVKEFFKLVNIWQSSGQIGHFMQQFFLSGEVLHGISLPSLLMHGDFGT